MRAVVVVSLLGCTIPHRSAMYWASDMLMASPPFTDEHGITHAAALVEATISCAADAAPARLGTDAGWLMIAS